MLVNDTIAAIATGMGNAGVGIIRISGKNAVEVASKVFRPANKEKKIESMKSYTAAFGQVYDGDKELDEGILLLMRAPHTYTCEDVCELQCHGGMVVLRNVLAAVIKNGARLAEPGEFTKRAFLNGRIDLSQAESVMDLISAKNDFAVKSSLMQLRGDLKNQIIDMREQILYNVAFIESALDDPEHYSLDGYPQKLQTIVDKLGDNVDKLLRTFDNGRILKEGIKTVIVGKPNAGKSSLLNMFLGENRAIVTNIAGTTRDTLEEVVNINGIILNIVDTAGIRDTEDIVEKIGVGKAKQMAEDADLILYVVDSSLPLDDNDREIMELLSGRKSIVIYNKTDLEAAVSIEELKEKTGSPVIPVSVVEETGLRQLEDEIKRIFFHGELSFNDEVYITNARHKAALEEAKESLRLVKESINMGMAEDFFSIDLKSAYECLGRIVGESVGEDLVNEIFSKFCVGK